MLEELDGIDVSAIEELEDIKKEQESLQQRLEKMEGQESSVSPKVFERVREDYKARHKKLEEKARPLKQRAQAAYAVLRGLIDRMVADLRSATLDTEELQLRHELGEFDDDEFAASRQECEERLQMCESLLKRGSELKANFIGAFHSEEELENGLPELPALEPPPPPLSEIEDSVPDAEGDAGESDEDVDEEEETETEEEDEESDADARDLEQEGTILLAPEAEDDADEEADSNYETQDRESEELEDESTAVTPQPRLVEIQEEGKGRVHALRVPATTVGRLNVNHICVPDGTVSRNHAKIVFGDHEITLYDLASENGLFVNEEQITEHILVSGDIIQFGAAEQLFEFRTD